MAEFADAQDLGAVTSVGLFHSLHALKTEYAPVVKLVYTMVLVLSPQGRLLEYNKEVLSMKRLSFFVPVAAKLLTRNIFRILGGGIFLAAPSFLKRIPTAVFWAMVP